MDLAYLLIADAIGLVIATLVLTYFFFKDLFKKTKEKESKQVYPYFFCLFLAFAKDNIAPSAIDKNAAISTLYSDGNKKVIV